MWFIETVRKPTCHIGVGTAPRSCSPVTAELLQKGSPEEFTRGPSLSLPPCKGGPGTWAGICFLSMWTPGHRALPGFHCLDSYALGFCCFVYLCKIWYPESQYTMGKGPCREIFFSLTGPRICKKRKRGGVAAEGKAKLSLFYFLLRKGDMKYKLRRQVWSHWIPGCRPHLILEIHGFVFIIPQGHLGDLCTSEPVDSCLSL